MTRILNITNGDAAAAVMKRAGIPGDVLPWRDVLHEGPVPGGLSLEALSAIRADDLADRGEGPVDEIKRSFVERDQALQSSSRYDRVMLWFEHDLYDQLQILQVLDWFHGNGQQETQLSIVCTDRYLGEQSPDEMADLSQYEEPVAGAHLRLASKAWAAFRSETPEAWQGLLQTDTSALPFLAGAIIRVLEEYPSAVHGLSRTAHHALDLVSQGENNPDRLFARYQQTEARRFLGNSSFWRILDQLLSSSPPLLALPEGVALSMPSRPDQALTITEAGKTVRSGARSWLDIVTVDHWIGGVHLTPENLWQWHADSATVVKV